ncbi:MAG: S1 RNA-binding domain-containing protein [Chloroflexi bacterium]|nr:S1 RNA-binding domain-containing protein [Chloroflexota bacterium]
MGSEQKPVEPVEEAQSTEQTAATQMLTSSPEGTHAGETPPATTSQPPTTAAKPSEQESRPKELEDLKPGMRLQGKVRNVVDFGAFIDIGVGRDGLAHVSTLKRAGIDKTIRQGDIIDVQIRRIDLERNRISLTIPGAGKGAKKALKDLEVGAVVSGRVVRLVDFGAFVDIGAQTDGLLHISEMSEGYVSHPSQVLNVGDEVQVRILDVDIEKRRISLSMKGMESEAEEEQPQREVAPTASTESQSDNDLPTAFQVAWETALRERRRKERRR